MFLIKKTVEEAGGKCLPVQVDIREEGQVKNAIDQTIKQFGGIDILVNNASAISITRTEETEMKRYDLMHQINTRGTFMTSKYAIPYLKKAQNPHILNISPPLLMMSRWFKDHLAYTMAKYGMSMCVLGMSEELREYGIAVNALWPKTAIWTAAMGMLGGEVAKSGCRKDTIMSDAAYAILSKDSKLFTGNICIDEKLLLNEGIKDFDQYAVSPGTPLLPDYYLPDEIMQEFKGIDLRQAIDSLKEKESSTETSAQKIFDSLKASINDEVKKEINAVISFVISGQKWVVDASESRPLKVEQTEAANPDITLITDVNTFTKMAKKEIKSMDAFMSGKLKIQGNIAIAMKIQRLFGEIKSKF